MTGIPPELEKILRKLGVSPTWLRWRMFQLKNWWRGKVENFRNRRPRQRYKFCRHCGHLALSTTRVCPGCRQPLPSYAAYLMRRALAIEKPEFGYVSTGFLGLIALLYCAQLALFGMKGLLAPSMEGLYVFGGFSTQLLTKGEVWRALTMALGHIGIIHLLFNLAAISQMMPSFEDEIGAWPTLVAITLMQMGAAAGHVVWYDPLVPTAGASGIAFGLIGFGVAFFHREGKTAERRFFIQWFWYGLIFGFLVRANNAAHVGGFLMGLPLGYLLAGMRPRGTMQRVWRAVGILSLAAWLVSLGFLVHNILTHLPE